MLEKMVAVVLAGGQSKRMGQDKARVIFQHKTMLEHVCDRIRPQVDELVINAQQLHQYQDLVPYQCLSDTLSGGRGPLAGVHTLLTHTLMDTFDYVLVVPCDAPRCPHDLVNKLSDALAISGHSIAMASINNIIQPTFSLWHKSVAPIVTDLIMAGEGSLKAITKRVAFDAVEWPANRVDDFININAPQDLQHLNEMSDD